LKLIDEIPAIQGPIGAPRFRPDLVQGDRAYGVPNVYSGLHARRLRALIPKMHSAVHGSGLGRFRFVVERTLAWLGNFRRLKLCYEKRGTHFQALHDLASSIICARKLAALTGVLK
jgi:transposase